MISKKCISFLLILGAVSCSIAFSNPEDKTKQTISELHAKIKKLEELIETQQQEIARLKNLCERHGIDTSPQDIKSPPKAISKAMFGIFLGESIESLKKRYKVTDSGISLEAQDIPGKMWFVDIDNPNIKRLFVITYQKQVYTIDVAFKDASRANYATLKEQLEKLYKSNDEGGLPGSVFSEGVYKPVIDNVQIRIKLNHNIGLMEEDKLSLSYVHTGIETVVEEEVKRRKASKIINEL